MHDRHGRLIELGDKVKFPRWMGRSDGEGQDVGVVGHVQPGAESCNMRVHYILPGQVAQETVTANKCELIAKANGDEPPPIVKAEGVENLEVS